MSGKGGDAGGETGEGENWKRSGGESTNAFGIFETHERGLEKRVKGRPPIIGGVRNGEM